jgi:cytochrome bd-type quinol oxidase subunit 1
MHRFQSKSAIVRLRFAAIFLCLSWILSVAAVGLLTYSLIEHNKKLTFVAMGLALAAIFVVVIQWILASRTRCPLCLTPVLASKGCSKHRNAKKLLGSYRLRVAMMVLFKGRFHCPYCHEPSVLEVRERNMHGRARMR